MEVTQLLATAISLGSFYALTALGIGLLFGVLGLVNFAHGDFITVGAYALLVPSSAATATLFIGAFNPVALVAGIVCAVVIVALLSEFLVFRHMREASPATLMIASFAISYIIQNLIIMIYGSRPKAVGLWSDLTRSVELAGGVEVPLLHFFIITVTLILLVLLTLFLKYTSLGLQLRAAAEDFRMARMLGVKGNLVIALAFALSGALAAVVAIFYTVQTGILSFRLGVPLMLFAFISTVIGGMNSLLGAVVGGYAVGIVSVLLQALLPEDLRPFRDAFVFAMVIGVLIFMPRGLISSGRGEERV